MTALWKSAEEQLYKISKNASQGDWESLNYTILTAEKIRIFLEYMNRTGNSYGCSQESVDYLEKDLKKHKTYANWAKNNPQAIQYAMGKAYVYLFTQVKLN